MHSPFLQRRHGIMVRRLTYAEGEVIRVDAGIGRRRQGPLGSQGGSGKLSLTHVLSRLGLKG